MASRGHVGGRYPVSTSPETIAFAEALAVLYKCFAPMTMAQVSELVQVSEASMSHYLNARRIAGVKTVTLLYQHALKIKVADRAPLVTFELQDLLSLREAAKAGPCPRCGKPRLAVVSSVNSAGMTTMAVPDSTAALDRRNSTATFGEDRRNAQAAMPRVEGLDQVVELMIEGRSHEASSILWALGATLPCAELATTVRFYYECNNAESAELLLRSAQHREAADILDIARCLLTLGQRSGLEVLLLGGGTDMP